MKIVLLSGPIAAGKTTLGKALAQRLNQKTQDTAVFLDLDDEVERLNGSHKFANPAKKLRTWLKARKNYAQKANEAVVQGKTAIVVGPFFSIKELKAFTGYLQKDIPVLMFNLNVPIEVRLKRNETRVEPNSESGMRWQSNWINHLKSRFGHDFNNDKDINQAVEELVDLLNHDVGLLGAKPREAAA